STAAAAYAYAFGQTFGVDIEICQLVSRAAGGNSRKLKEAAAQYCDLLGFVDPNLPAEWYQPDFQISKVVAENELALLVSEPSNLLVLGVQPASFLQRHLRTSRAYRLLAKARSPVLTVPAIPAIIDGL